MGVGSVPAAQQDRHIHGMDSTLMSDSVLQSLLHEYRDCCPDRLPDGLPPERKVGHAIHTEPRSSPADRHMYRMTPAEKVEMERPHDILIFSKSLEEHAQHLKVVLDLLRKHESYAKMSTCEFTRPELQFLGHIVSQDGMKMDPQKTAVIDQWPVPEMCITSGPLWV